MLKTTDEEKKTATKQQGQISTVASLELELALIDEDPNQPRTEFDPITLQELADTIRLRGVKTPISVHPNSKMKGRFVINHGARRYRASKLAGKKTIPAFIDLDYSRTDQIIENLQRDNLTPREIAGFIGYQLSKGISQMGVARMIGKSGGFVGQHVALLDLPEVISTLFNSGKIRDVTIIAELVRVYKLFPIEITRWLNDKNLEITRNSLKLIREYLRNKHKQKIISKDEVSVDLAPKNSDAILTQAINKESKKRPKEPVNEEENILLELIEQVSLNVKLQDSPKQLLNNLSINERKQLGILLYKLMRVDNSKEST